MEFLRHFTQAFSDGIDRFVSWFTALFEYFIAIGVRQETLILILIGGGISFLVMLVALFLAMSKVRLRSGRVAAETPAKPALKKSTSRFSQMFKPKADNGQNMTADVKENADMSANGKGFAIFKKRKKPSRPKVARDSHKADGPHTMGQDAADTVISQLTQIERDMLALKELYEAGHITVDVYVSESRTLYERAKTLQ